MTEERAEALAIRSKDCRLCGAPFTGALSYPFLLVGIRRSPRNPNLCNRCSTHVEDGELVDVTILVADLSGFTRLTHELGPDRTHAIVDRFLRRATEILVAHDAYIDKYIGDAVMAYFNAPVRRPDHARRAMAAAREIQLALPEIGREMGVALGATTAIASGRVRLGRLGSDEMASITAIGDAVNLASRLESETRSGEILMDATVHAAVRDDLPDISPENLTLKGFPEPVEAFRLSASGIAGWPIALTDEFAAPPKRVSALGVVFSVLAAPCVGWYVLSPFLYSIGFGAVLDSAIFSSIDDRLDDGPLRISFSILALVGAGVNLGILVRAHRRKRLKNLRVRRSAFLLGALAVVTIALVGFELFVHLHLYGKKFLGH